MIPNAILVLNGKGGVLKTSLVANLGGFAAASGWRVLLVDLDPQGNLGRDLGYIDRSDDGAALASAVINGTPPEPLRSVRERLDVLAGGPKGSDMVAELQRALIGGDLYAPDRLDDALAPLAADYDVVIIDIPPYQDLLHAAALRTAHYVLIPTQPDAASIDGLGHVGGLVNREGQNNPDLEILGVSVGPLQPQATTMKRAAHTTLRDLLGDDITIFQTTVRDAKKAAVDCRDDGMLAIEYEAASKGNRRRYSAAASTLAGDYQNLANEVFARFLERQTAYTERVA